MLFRSQEEGEEENEDESAEAETGEEKEVASVPSGRKPSKSTDFKSLSVDKLNDMLKEAIENEDYERAARIRDELNKRN